MHVGCQKYKNFLFVHYQLPPAAWVNYEYHTMLFGSTQILSRPTLQFKLCFPMLFSQQQQKDVYSNDASSCKERNEKGVYFMPLLKVFWHWPSWARACVHDELLL